MENLASVDYIIVLISLVFIFFLLLLLKNYNQTCAIFPKDGKLLNLSLNEIHLMKVELSSTTFPFLSRMILFQDVRQELLLCIKNSEKEEKFLSNLIKYLEVIHDYDFGPKKTTSLIRKVLPKYYWRIFQEIKSYEKPEKPRIITLLIEYFRLMKDKKCIFIEDELRLRLACLIVKSEKSFKDQIKLVSYLGCDELEMINKFKAA